MEKKRFAITAGLGCTFLMTLLALIIFTMLFTPFWLIQIVDTGTSTNLRPNVPQVPGVRATQEAIPTLTPASSAPNSKSVSGEAAFKPPGSQADLKALYETLNPGVVNIQVYVERAGLSSQGAGSGFILDNEGHIVTNNHVIAEAEQVTAIFFNELEAEAEVIGSDDDSDLAIIKVDQLAEGAHPLPLGNSDNVEVGEWVIAIGNPFGQQSSMSVGIVSDVGRTIPSGVTPFAIPEAIQTDAAINPGNSGGPLLNLQGEVIGVNAQIATGSGLANSGVGFAIPINVVRRVAPVLIETGTYYWPWLGVQGRSVNLALMQANNLDSQRGAYIGEVIADGPADEASLQGSTGTQQINGLEVPVGGDVVIEADGQAIIDFNDLLAHIAAKNPTEEMALTVLRDGQRKTFTVTLMPRPSNFTR